MRYIGVSPWGTGRAARGDDLTQYPSSAAFSPPFQQEQGRQGKGKQLRHQLQYHLPTCSAPCQPHCLAPLLRSASATAQPLPFSTIWNFYSSSNILILGSWASCWKSFLKLFLGGLCQHISVKCSLFPYKEGFEKFSLMCVTNSFIRTYL